MTDISNEHSIVLTLDAGGTSLRFCGMRAGKRVTDMVALDTHGDNLELCLMNIVGGFARVREMCPVPPVAISFAFPGPADYPNGIIGDLGNLPAFRGGIALGPILREKFGIPVFISNDGDLFAFGESIAGFLPYVNGLLEKGGSPKRYRNLLGVTLGTGFGGGIARNGELLLGDNSVAGEIWLLRNKLLPAMNVEQSVSIRAVRRVYPEVAGIPLESAPDPKDICKIGTGASPGNRNAACEAFRQLGEAAGDAVAQTLNLVDGLVVIGGGLANAWPLFVPSLVAELNATYKTFQGQDFRRLAVDAFNLEDSTALEMFVRGNSREIIVPKTGEKVLFDLMPRIAIGISRLGTSEAIALGAYAFALQKLNQKN
ncbi:MAG: glucokinase [Pedosphaera sp.]|nr:glucokinase [Pedosphaera sp.]